MKPTSIVAFFVMAIFSLSSALFAPVVYAQSGSVSVGGGSSVSCNLTADNYSIPVGGSITLTWQTSGYDTVVVNGQTVGASGSMQIGGIMQDTIYELNATNSTGDTCHQVASIVCLASAPACTLTPQNQTINYGESTTLTWTTTNADTASLSSVGNVALNDSVSTGPLTATQSYTLNASGAGGDVSCPATVTVLPQVLAPSCDSFIATPVSIVVGDSATLEWQTTNATQVLIDNGIGQVDANGSVSVSPLSSVTYQLTVVGDNNQTDTCTVPVTVTNSPVPACTFTASPNTLPAGGGSVALDWNVTNAVSVDITPSIGAVGFTGSQNVNVLNTTNYLLTAVDGSGNTVTCPATVTVDSVVDFSCANNVSFSASDYSLVRGQTSTLSWNTTGADTVSISGINATSLSGSQDVAPSDDITYTLTATRGAETINCPLSVSVTSGGGGGGGSSSPRCELEISDNLINLGETITLTWDTTRATEVTLTDDRGIIIFTTDDYLTSEKSNYYDGSIELNPTRDTEYTLLAERGSRDVECVVSVELAGLVISEAREQPLVASIQLSEVPYTGFEAGPTLTALFYVLLVSWSLYIAYLMVIKNRVVSGASEYVRKNEHIDVESNLEKMKKAETLRPDLFVPVSVRSKALSPDLVPNNLPVGEKTVGYDNFVVEENITETEAIESEKGDIVPDQVSTTLENHAHEQRALLSSDAVEYLMRLSESEAEQIKLLNEVIVDAKKHYPMEDGWIVINESRMKNVCEACNVIEAEKVATSEVDEEVAESVIEEKTGEQPEVKIPVSEKGAGLEGQSSLAEAIVTGNIVAAYQMIGHRPMIALADAATDFDGVVRMRKGESVNISDLLKEETSVLSDETINNIVKALTGALDGVYTDEASAVKMAIMKAVKEVA